MANYDKPRWHFNEGVQLLELPDPRIAIARQINWTRGSYGKEFNLTDWSVPEPDNYNVALFSFKPVECDFVKNQVWYYDSSRYGWFSVYHVDRDTKVQWIRWIRQQSWIAYWIVHKDSAMRKNRTLLNEKRYKNTSEIGLNQRLHQMNFYSSLLNKLEEDTQSVIKERIGEA